MTVLVSVYVTVEVCVWVKVGITVSVLVKVAVDDSVCVPVGVGVVVTVGVCVSHPVSTKSVPFSEHVQFAVPWRSEEHRIPVQFETERSPLHDASIVS
jgi:hypothetical protein